MLREKLDDSIKAAMLCRNESMTRTLRLVKAEYTKFTTAENAKPLDDAAELSILRRMLKERLESSGQYLEAGRKDLSDIELEEANIIREFIPQETPREELEAYADSIITEKGMASMGKYMKQMKEKFPYSDGKTVSEIVKARLI